MTTPIVTEIIRRPEPVAHDTFIDDLRSPRGPRGGVRTDPPPGTW